MKKKNLLIGLSMMAFAGASLASCGSTNITETSFTVNEVTLKDGVEAFEKTENQLEKWNYHDVVSNRYRDEEYIVEDLKPYVEKLEGFRHSIVTDYESYTKTVYYKNHKTNRVTYEKAIMDFKTANLFYYLDSYIEKDGKKEETINITTKAYRKDCNYTVVSDIALDSYKYTTNEINRTTGTYIQKEVSGTGKFYTTFISPFITSNEGEYIVIDSMYGNQIESAITSPALTGAEFNDASEYTISKDFSYSYFEYSNGSATVKSLVEDFMLKASSHESKTSSLFCNYSLNKEKAFGNNEEPNLDGYAKYDYEPKNEGYAINMTIPFLATPFQGYRMYVGESSCYMDLFSNDDVLSKFQVKSI